MNQSIETTTVPTEHYGTTITVDNTEDTATVIVNPPVIEGTLETSDGKQKDNEEEQNKKEDDAAAADKKNEDQTHLVVENETAKTDEPMTENVAIQTDEPTTEIVPAQPDNGPEEPKETTTGTNIAKDTHVFTNNTNSRKYNNIYSAAKPPDADGNAGNYGVICNRLFKTIYNIVMLQKIKHQKLRHQLHKVVVLTLSLE